MSEAHLARPRYMAASGEARVRYGMMRGAERPRGHKGIPVNEHSGDAMHSCRFNRLVERHVGKNRGEAPGQHRLAGAGRPYHEDVMPSRGRDRKRPFHVFLPLDVAYVAAFSGSRSEVRLYVYARFGNVLGSVQKLHQLPEALDPVNRHAFANRRLFPVFSRNYYFFTEFFGEHRARKRAAHGPYPSVEGEFSKD